MRCNGLLSGRPMQETTALGVARLAMEVSGSDAVIEMDEDRFEPNTDLESMFQRWSGARRAIQTLSPDGDID